MSTSGRAPGGRALEDLLRRLQPTLDDDEFVFCSVAPSAVPQDVAPALVFPEDEGVTLILRRVEAERRGLGGVYPCRRITLRVESSLEAVGLLAAVCARLAAAGISVNPVSAYHHDHLFVPSSEAERALSLLQALQTPSE